MIGEARKLHPQNQFDIIDMQGIRTINRSFDCLLFLASFHHLSTRDERIQVMQDSKKLLQPNGRIYMTNWNLRDQAKYQMSHQ
jgi:2-polyprenyl-3-methyl-5-hydroxy-6-metoxy-1,4-benzoquinol methylase